MLLFGKPWARWMVLICSAALIIGTLMLYISPTQASTRLAAARVQWAARSFSGYRLVIEESAVRCHQDVGVQDEIVVRRFSDSCRTVPWTVTGLFTIAERNHSTRYQCVDRGCACDTVMTARVAYDPQVGYPSRLEFHWTIAPNMRHPDFWRQLLSERAIPTCRSLSYHQTIQVMSLTPIR